MTAAQRRNVEQKKLGRETESERTSDTSTSGDSESEELPKIKSERAKRKSGRHFKKWLTLEKFDGTTPLSIFLNQLDTCAQYNGWNKEDRASHLRVSLKGNAAYIIDEEKLKGASYSMLIKHLKNRFGTEGQSSLYRSQLRTRRRGKEETRQTLYHDINRMAGLAYPGKRSIHRELAAIDAFIDALNDSNLRMRVRDKEPKNFDHAFHIALLAEANTEAKHNATQEEQIMRGKDYKGRVVQNAAIPTAGASNVSIDSVNSRGDKICKMLETMFKNNNADGMMTAATAAATAARVPTTPPARANVTCFKCGNLGNYATACPDQSSSGKRGDGKGPIRCYGCQGFGHMARSCPKTAKKEADTAPAENVRGIKGPDTRQMKDHPVYLEAYLGKRAVSFLVDTGCERSVAPRKLTSDEILEPDECRLFTANGIVINVVGEVTMNIRISDLILPTRLVVSDNVTETMLGVD